MSNVTHITIHHDPEGRCNYLLERHISDLRLLFADGFIVTTKETNNKQKTRRLLEQAGFRLTVRNSFRERQLDTAGHIGLVAGYSRGKGDFLYFGCLDRTLHWLEKYPDELKELLTGKEMANTDYLIIGRTERALATHPEAQLKPEIATDEITARLLGMDKVDVATGCRMMTKETAKEIVKFLWEERRFTNPGIDIADSLWPYIAHLLKRKVGFIRTEGLEFETPDQFKKEIEELGYEEWTRRNFTEENVARRIRRALETEKTLLELSQMQEGKNRNKERS